MSETFFMQTNESRDCNPCYVSRIEGLSSDSQFMAASLMVHYGSKSGQHGSALSPNFDMGPTITLGTMAAMAAAKADDIYTSVMDPAHRKDFENKVQTQINDMLPNNHLQVDKVELTSINFSDAFIAAEALKKQAGVDLTGAEGKAKEAAKDAYNKMLKSWNGDGK